MSEIPQWKKDACKWCAQGCAATVDRCTIHKVYPLTSSGGFRSAEVTSPLSQYFRCTAPTEAEHIATLTAEVAELNHVNLQCLADMETSAKKCIAERDRTNAAESALREAREALIAVLDSRQVKYHSEDVQEVCWSWCVRCKVINALEKIGALSRLTVEALAEEKP